VIYEQNAGKIGLLSRDEIVNLIRFSGELYDLIRRQMGARERRETSCYCSGCSQRRADMQRISWNRFQTSLTPMKTGRSS
jgi:hypothetical protein